MNIDAWIRRFSVHLGTITIASIIFNCYIQKIDFRPTNFMCEVENRILSESINDGSQIIFWINNEEAIINVPTVNLGFQIRLPLKHCVLQVRHIEVSKGHSKWRAHANSINLGVEGSIRWLEGASDGAGLQQLAQDVLGERQRREGLISIDTVAYYINCFSNRDIGKERFYIKWC